MYLIGIEGRQADFVDLFKATATTQVQLEYLIGSSIAQFLHGSIESLLRISCRSTMNHLIHLTSIFKRKSLEPLYHSRFYFLAIAFLEKKGRYQAQGGCFLALL